MARFIPAANDHEYTRMCMAERLTACGGRTDREQPLVHAIRLVSISWVAMPSPFPLLPSGVQELGLRMVRHWWCLNKSVR